MAKKTKVKVDKFESTKKLVDNAKKKGAQTAQESVPYKRVYEDTNTNGGIIEVEDNVFTKSYVISDTNYSDAGEERQEEILQIFEQILNSFVPNVRYEITLNNRTIDEEEFNRRVLLEYKNDKYDTLRAEHNELILEKLQEGKNNTRVEKYITIGVTADTVEEAMRSFADIERELSLKLRKINNRGLDGCILSLHDRLEIIYEIYNEGKENTFSLDLNALTRQGITTKDLIAPSFIDFRKNDYIQLDNKYARVFFLKGLPTILSTAVLENLTRIATNIVLSVHYEIQPQDKAVSFASAQVTNIGGEVLKAQKGLMNPDLISPKLQTANNDARMLLETITNGSQSLFHVTLVATIFADSLDDLNLYSEQFRTRARDALCSVDILRVQQEQGFYSTLPLANNLIEAHRVMTTESASAFQPFSTQEMQIKGGYYYGLNQHSKNIIIYNRGVGFNRNGVILGSPGCVDKETEYFNGKKWKSISEYTDKELVLQFDTKTNTASLVKPLRYIKEKCDKMYHFETKYGINQTLSPEHRVIYYTDKKANKANIISAEELKDLQNNGKFNGKFRTTFNYSGEGISLTDTEIKLMLAVIADGSFNANNIDSFNCTFNLKKARKKNELYSLLKEYGCPFRIYETDDGYTHYSFNAPVREKEFLSYWYDCSDRQLQLICDNILKWDGRVDKKNRRSFFTSNKTDADFVQFAFSSCGHRAVVTERKNRIGEKYTTNEKEYIRNSKEYVVTISDKMLVGMAHHHDGRDTNVYLKEVVPSDGYKYCFTVPTHALVLRRNGRIFITGNSGKSFAAKMEMYQAFLSDNNSQIFVIDPEREYVGLGEALGASIIKIQPDSEGKVCLNPLDLDITRSDEGDPVSEKIDFIISVIETMMGGHVVLSGYLKSIVDNTLQDLYSGYIKHLTDTNQTIDINACPTLLDFYNKLRGRKEPEALNLAQSIQIYCTGSLNLFAHHTNIDTSNRFVIYDTKNIGTNLKELGMQICLNDIWNRMIANRAREVRTLFYVDEFYLMLRSINSARYLEMIWKRARKWLGAPTGITQNVSDLINSEQGNAILKTSDFALIMPQSFEDRIALSEIYQISEELQQYVSSSAGSGEGLIYTKTAIVPFENHIPNTSPIYKLLSTKASDDEQIVAEIR